MTALTPPARPFLDEAAERPSKPPRKTQPVFIGDILTGPLERPMLLWRWREEED